MSTVVTEPFDFPEYKEEQGSSFGDTTKPKLRAVPDSGLLVQPVRDHPHPPFRVVASNPGILTDPVTELQPAVAPSDPPPASLRSVPPLLPREAALLDPVELETMKKMTQSIGAAFVEAEIGLRPFAQLSTWLELTLFQKLRTRVEYSASQNYLGSRNNRKAKVPSIHPVGVRASKCPSGDWETSMTIRVGDRARAIAMRLQLHRHRWRVIALEIG